ncbi:MAG: putative peptide zinc metalloprotease protein, partial [Solirubrobacteraceae bacterium]|nr:putative peptide zinc metalloprotease protein [Solirubrobacteraceae bacterium]
GWVRIVVSGYVVLVVLFFLVTILALLINLPRMVATGYDSAALRYAAVGPAFDRGQTLSGVLDAVQLLFLVLPAAGLGYTVVRVTGRSASGARRWASGAPGRQVALGLVTAVGVAVAAFSLWPNGEYRPVQPGERGTLTGVVNEVAALPTGRPSLTPQRQRQLGGAPTERQRQAHNRRSAGQDRLNSSTPATTTTPSDTTTTDTTPTTQTAPTDTTPATTTTTTPAATSAPTSTTTTTAAP